jgi:hypothetical protein
MEYELTRHPDSEAIDVSGVRALLEHHRNRFLISYVVDAPGDRLVLPPPANPCRTDRLWESTCFELFLQHAGPEYFEFNFSPSGRWAAYHFSAYRAGMRPLPLEEPPAVRVGDRKARYSLSVVLDLPCAAPLNIGMSAIIEERTGAKSYWALFHPEGKPDFHHAKCFVEFPR